MHILTDILYYKKMKAIYQIKVLSTRFSRCLCNGITVIKKVINTLTNNQPWKYKYTPIKTLGSGGNANVVLVTDNNGKQFALKPLDKEYITQKNKRKRFLREVNVMKNDLSNLSGVIPIIDYCEKGYWYVMPVASKSMDVIKKMNLEQRIDAILSIAETLKIIHSRKISHRDIKPANILYYNNHFCFCDFGLCHIEDSKLTKKRDNIGAKFTIAPEMKRDSKCSDPYKADVYSMGKTLWMYLTENEDAFEGRYNPIESSIGLHYFEQYKDSNIAEIEFLLEAATMDNPDDRPTIDEFCIRLSNWITISKNKDFAAIQRSELRMLKHLLSPSCEINSLTITNSKEIVKALNYFRLTPVLNHMLYPQGGGLDFDFAEIATEDECIALHSQQGTIDILKPKQFVFESFDDYKWFYFLIETDTLTPILTKDDVLSEELLEDTPGHYCDALDYVYGVYDYDSGKKLPKSARRVERFCKKGIFLILPKQGYYNQQTSTYDGRQNNCTVDEFKAYIQKMKALADEGENRGYSFYEIVNALNKLPNPFRCPEEYNSLNELKESVIVPETFILDIVKNLDISSILLNIEDKNSPATFAVYVTNEVLESPISLFCLHDEKIRWFLCNDGKIRKTCWKDNQVLKLHDRCTTNSLIETINTTIDNLYHEAGFENDGLQSTCCSMTLYKTGKPTHMFTKQEINMLMKNADDRLGNTLVINEFGFAQIIPGHFDKHTYPVSQETWCSRNNYVGKYSSLSDLDQSYEWMLEGWLDYLERGVAVYMDYSSNRLTVKELLKEIKKHY